MNITEILSNELNIQLWQVEKAIELLDAGNTVPFISRYRKEMTGSLDDSCLRRLEERLTSLRNLEKRKEEVKQNVLRQTGKIFQNFDEAVKTGILGELADEGLIPIRTETFLQEDEVEELEEIQEEGLSAIEQVIAQELDGDTVDIPQEKLEEALLTMEQQEEECDTEEMTFEEELEQDSKSEEMYYEEESYIEEESFMQEMYEQEEYVEEAYAEKEYFEAEECAEYEEYVVSEDETYNEEEEQLLKTQEISMNTEEISSLPNKIIEATKKETKAVKREEIREFTPEEKDLFENFAVTKKIRKQIIGALDTMSLAAYTGNVLITGEPGLGTVRLAKNLIREYQIAHGLSSFTDAVRKLCNDALEIEKIRH